jgi:hypothetical protein
MYIPTPNIGKIHQMQRDIHHQTLFTPLLMTPRTKKHREDSKSANEFWQDAPPTILNVMCRDDMNFSVVHVICNDGFPRQPQQREANSILGEL